MDIQPWNILVFCTAYKLLIFPAYHSTDFEVHRHWLSLTHTLPISQWYTDQTSNWTLDYPPFFAWFEWALSQIGRWVDPAMLVLGNQNYASFETVAFQRGTVVASEFLLFAATWYATRHTRPTLRKLTLFLVAAHPGLMIVDHMHFQYNGVLLGMFVLSMALVREGRDLAGGVLFAALLNFKHVFLYAAPVFFVHLLARCCRARGWKGLGMFLALGAYVAGVFALSLGPFVAMGQLPQVLRRLFPFSRGLLHAYWAPNLWALYAATDKVVGGVLLPLLGVQVPKQAASMTGGLVGVSEFAVLPQIGSGTCVLAVLAALAPCLAATWRDPSPSRFPAAVLYSTMCSFMLGYHVHEKAILMVAVPLAVLGVGSHPTPSAARDYLFLATLSTFSLFPLIFSLQEYPIKVLLLVGYCFVASIFFRELIVPPPAAPRPRPATRAAARKARAAAGKAAQGGESPGGKGDGAVDCSSRQVADGGSTAGSTSVSWWSWGEEEEGPPRGEAVLLPLERAYLYCLVPLEVYCTALHRWLLGGRLPFVPLMLTSTYCAVGMMYAWWRLGAPFLLPVLRGRGRSRRQHAHVS